MVLDAHRDAKSKGEDWLDRVKASLLVAHPDGLRRLWPEVFDKTVKNEQEVEEALESNEPVEWQFENTMSAADADKLLSSLLANTGGDLAMETTDEDDDGDWI